MRCVKYVALIVVNTEETKFVEVQCLTNSVTILVSMVFKSDFTVKHYFETVHVDIHMQSYLIQM